MDVLGLYDHFWHTVDQMESHLSESGEACIGAVMWGLNTRPDDRPLTMLQQGYHENNLGNGVFESGEGTYRLLSTTDMSVLWKGCAYLHKCPS